MKLPILIISAFAMSGVHAGSTSGGTIAPTAAHPAPLRAAISGIEEGGRYGDLPPVLVEFARLSRHTAVWVEIYRGPAREFARGRQVKSDLFLRESGGAVLNVEDLSRIHAEGGTWTLQVLENASLGTQVVARTTFTVQRNGPAIEGDLVRLSR